MYKPLHLATEVCSGGIIQQEKTTYSSRVYCGTMKEQRASGETGSSLFEFIERNTMEQRITDELGIGNDPLATCHSVL